MKHTKLFYIGLVLILALPLSLFSQVPDGVNYQAVVRNGLGLPLNTQTVSVRFTIHQGSPTGTPVFQEVQPDTTNQFGLINLQLGSINTAAFSAINWGTGGAYYLQIEVDVVGLGVFEDLGASQLLSVPYALFAKSAATGQQGFNSLIDTVAAGASCPNGGYQVLLGLDTNANTVLDPVEVTSSFFVCNGSSGISINWQGSFSTAPVGNPNDAYYNSTDGVSYIYNGTTSIWDTLVAGGAGASDNDWIIVGNDMSSGITGNVGIGVLLPSKKLSVKSFSTGGDGIQINNASATGNPGIEFQTQGITQYVLGVDQTDSNKFKIGTLGVNVNTRFTIDNSGQVGIGTINPNTQLTVFSTDSIIASFTGLNPDVAAITVIGLNPSAAVGMVMLSGADSGIVAMDPIQKMLVVSNSTPNGHVVLNADSSVTSYGEVIGNIANSKIINQADTIYSFPTVGNNIININAGTFVTDSLYKLGNNAGNVNWVLANNGFGQAVWTDPLALPSGGGLWQSNVLDIFFNTGYVGIGTNTPSAILNLLSPDTIGLYVEGTNTFGTFNITKSLAGTMVGELYTSGTDTVFHSLEPANSSYYISYEKKIGINTDSLSFGSFSGTKIITENQGDFYNQDTIFTSNLYVYDGASTVGDVLTNIGGGRALWQVPSGSSGSWTSNGTETFLNSINDKVGIGTNTPMSMLHIQDNLGLAPEVLLETTAGNFDIGFRYKTALAEWFMGQETASQQFRISDRFSSTTPFVINQADGYVGIGTNTPLVRLHIVEDAQAIMAVQSSNSIAPDQSSNVSLLRSRGNSTTPSSVWGGDRLGKLEFLGWDGSTWAESASIRAIADENFSGIANGTHLEFYTTPIGTVTDIEAMRIQENGFIGIGTPSPNANLDVTGVTETDNLRVLAGAGVAGDVLMSDAAGNATWQTPPAAASGWDLLGNSGTIPGNNFLGTTDAISLEFRTNNIGRMLIDVNGLVGIGTTIPGGKLEVFGGDMILSFGHLISKGTTPTASMGTISGTDVAGVINITVAAIPYTEVITFNTPYINPPTVTLTPANQDAGDCQYYVVSNTTGFTVVIFTVFGGFNPIFNYMVIGN